MTRTLDNEKCLHGILVKESCADGDREILEVTEGG